jgi:hypothetical protein|tara:strand:+ start:1639 stop:2001 length:363 start_codon:yes stop_codon:yes gene_type:complete
MKTFDDLNFTPHAHAKDLGVSASLTLDNGYSFSVVANTDGGDLFYGNYPNTFEVAIFNQRGDFVPLGACDDVLGWQLPHQITALMHQFEIDGIKHEKLLHDLRNDFNKKVLAKHEEEAEL